MGLFTCKDYKTFLRSQVDINKALRGYQGQLARAAQCQPSFLSRVLNSDAHLTRDQAADLCYFWRLGADESEYFINLLDLERASSSQLKSQIQKRIDEIKNGKSPISQTVQKISLSDSDYLMKYYSSWYWSAIHVSTSIPKLQNPKEMGEYLNIPLNLIIKTLSSLNEMGLVKKIHDRQWVIKEIDLHLPNESIMNEINHRNWRQKAILNIQKNQRDSMHYSSIFSISNKDVDKFKTQLLNMLKLSRDTIISSKEEELFCFNLDFFQL